MLGLGNVTAVGTAGGRAVGAVRVCIRCSGHSHCGMGCRGAALRQRLLRGGLCRRVLRPQLRGARRQQARLHAEEEAIAVEHLVPHEVLGRVQPAQGGGAGALVGCMGQVVIAAAGHSAASKLGSTRNVALHACSHMTTKAI